MERINLHTHSEYSLDGKLEINELINTSFNKGIVYLSITDHNNCDAYSEIDFNKINKSGTVIYGMEADALINNVTYDILCYGFDVKAVNSWAKQQYGTVASRQLKIYKKLEELCQESNLILDDSSPYNPENEFAHIAVFKMLETNLKNKEFLNNCNIQNAKDFYRESTMNIESPFYINMNIVWPKIETLAQVIHENGGKIFLAHPYKYAKNTNIDKILLSTLPFVDGIEVSNEPKTAEEVNYLYKFAKDNNLLICAGSDYHGSENHKDLDVHYLTEDMENDIENWIKKIDGKILIN